MSEILGREGLERDEETEVQCPQAQRVPAWVEVETTFWPYKSNLTYI